jgi:uncharacterized protein YbjT (DUF2867 family)
MRTPTPGATVRFTDAFAVSAKEGVQMKIVVIGGTGLIGSNVVLDLRQEGHESVAASPGTGVNTVTGEGLDDVLRGSAVVVDVSNSPSFEDVAVMEFFETSTRNILAAAAGAGVGHVVALSVVGSERLPDSGYLRAKVMQEKLIRSSDLPFSILHATQFYEFITRIADDATEGSTVRLPPVLFQPIAAADVASMMSKVALGSPVNGTIEMAGPEQFRFDEIVRRALIARGDPRVVVAEPHASYFGTQLAEHSLVPGDGAILATTRYEDWLAHSEAGAAHR